MAEELKLGTQVRELKLGASFRNPRSTAFHTVRYDFKPASVDVNKPASIDVGTNNQITVTVPHLDGAGTSQTVFKGSKKPYQKECVLIIDKATGEITLERLTSNIQVKKTRSESNHKQLPNLLSDKPVINSNVNSTKLNSKFGKKNSRKDHNTSSSVTITKSSPKHISPAHHSPVRSRSPLKPDQVTIKSASASPIAQQTLASLPLIGGDDFTITTKTIISSDRHDKSPYNNKKPFKFTGAVENTVPANNINTKPQSGTATTALSDSSSSTSSSSDDSDSESDTNNQTVVPNLKYPNSEIKVSDSSDSDSDDAFEPVVSNISKPSVSVPNPTRASDHLLKEDLRLSESGSDSD